ncbi:MAG: endolytic transglycosylase MltG [Pseudobacteriovorax sp.]|nr:endolytic transglycosylase MltG [Pseudobacteriovorax sp.]
MIRKLLKYIVFLGLLAIVGLFGGRAYLDSWSKKEVMVEKAAIIHFPSGTRLDELSGTLSASGLIDDPLLFNLWVRQQKTYGQYQAGVYRFSGAITPKIIQDKIISGVSYNPIVLQFVIPEGFTLEQTLRRLVANNVGDYDELYKLSRDKAFLKSLNVKSPTLEGYLYPATYSFTAREPAKAVLKKMVNTFWENLPKDYEKNVKKKGLSLHEAITFASLIEKETQHDDERSLVSEVIWSRLKNREPIAIDAAIIYGIEDYDGDIKWKHLRDKSNPYNTRVHKGLPPGPIGAVSAASLEAILTPTNFGYYYYVVIGGTNRHHFSKTLKEHNKHVQLYLDYIKRK